MELLQIVVLSTYLSSTLVSLLLVVAVRSWFTSNRYTTIRGRLIRVKHPWVVILILLIISFIPILNTISAYKLLSKILT